MPEKKPRGRPGKPVGKPAKPGQQTGKPGQNPKPNDGKVYVDLLFDAGLLWFVITNTCDTAVENVRVAFNHPVIGIDGADIAGLDIFDKLEFLPAGKEIPVFIDRAASYLARQQRNVLRVITTYRVGGKSHSTTVDHDIRAYTNLPYVINETDTRRLGLPTRHN